MSTEMLCSCAMLKIPKNHIVNCGGVVHRTSPHCYILDREKFERTMRYILDRTKDSSGFPQPYTFKWESEEAEDETKGHECFCGEMFIDKFETRLVGNTVHRMNSYCYIIELGDGQHTKIPNKNEARDKMKEADNAQIGTLEQIDLENKIHSDEAQRKIFARQDAFWAAKKMTESMVEQHGLKMYGVGNPFLPTAVKYTPAEQHLNLILSLADWLMATD